MAKRNQILLVVGLLLIFSWSCDNSIDGDFSENQPPKTFLTVQSIDRSEENRLSSQINISWWGVDPDGYIAFFEYAINDTSESAWTRVNGTDSTFILPITEGESTDDVLFKIRAVDNEGARDPDGARLVYPVINSDPDVSLNNPELPADTMYSITSFGWTIEDPDGLQNILRTEIAINDKNGEWISIPFDEGSDQVFVSLEVDNSSEGEKTANLFYGRSFLASTQTISNVQVGASNKFYVRVIDQAGAQSPIDSTSWYIKEQTSRVLFFNDVSGSSTSAEQAYHLDILDQNGIQPDVWLINDGGAGDIKERLSESFPETIDPTLIKTLAKWDYIYWLSNNLNRNITYVEQITSEFSENGGKFFITIPATDGDITSDDPLFNVLSVDSIGERSGSSVGFKIDEGEPVTPSDNSFPLLQTSRDIDGLLPLKPSSGATSLYTVDFKEDQPGRIPDTDFTRFETIAIENSEGNIIYFGVDIRNIDGNGNAADIIATFCIQRLGFQQ